jgi:GT2 family glycosyltransferase
MSPAVAICIATHNRCEELARTLRQIATLEPAPGALVIVADGCTDGTVALVRDLAPHAQLIEHAAARGSIASRNEAAAACACEVFLSLDDDSYPLEKDFLAKVSAQFAGHPRLAVLSFPQRSDEFPESLAATNFGPSLFTGSYANSGAAIRRAAFEELGGYPDFFFHAYEEPDFALRCVAAGWQVRHETSLTVRHHFTGVQRNEVRTHQRHARNEIWSVLLRCPAPQLFGVLLFRTLRQAGYAARRGISWLVREPAWWLACLGGVARCLGQRKPLPWGRYLAWMRLVRQPVQSEAEWTAIFGKEGA